jgi:feruloyl esterase
MRVPWSGDSSAWTNLSTFRGHGGKLIFLHGVSDPWFSAQETVRYYELLGRDNRRGTVAGLEPPVPRARHGSLRWRRAHTRPGRSIGPLVDWVEAGRAPERVIATGKSAPAKAARCAPTPPMRSTAAKGDARDAANYSCN